MLAAATSADTDYDGLDPADVSVVNVDDDSAGFIVGPVGGSATESGGTATFTVRLASQPSSDVTLDVSSGDVGEGTAAPTSLTFTSANWNAVDHIVTITGVDDDIEDGSQILAVVLGAATSADTAYNGLDPADVSVGNIDNDSAGITVGFIDGDTSEAGGTGTFTVALNSQPAVDVTIPVTSSETSEGTVAPASLVFTAANWNAAQTVTVTGVDDSVADGNRNYTILLGAAVSDDSNYSGLDARDVSVANTDNDSPGVTITVENTSESGGTSSFTVMLNSMPDGDVVFVLASSDTTEGTVGPSSLTFTVSDWNSEQTVVLTGVDDDEVDGDQEYSISMTVDAVRTTDTTGYANLVAPNVAVVNEDDDSDGGATSGDDGEDSEDSEGGGPCFIATAAYGSIMEPHVQILRDFRDRFLNTNSLGRQMVSVYYSNSPPLADMIASRDYLRTVVRWTLLPLVGFSWLALNLNPLLQLALLLGIGGVLLVFLSKRRFRFGVLRKTEAGV
ncbi:MAG: hypothetical protein GY866_34145 [Proteobacteria bacterium]|nr:hypothetical protein [Pseudomonadota bacterium]